MDTCYTHVYSCLLHAHTVAVTELLFVICECCSQQDSMRERLNIGVDASCFAGLGAVRRDDLTRSAPRARYRATSNNAEAMYSCTN